MNEMTKLPTLPTNFLSDNWTCTGTDLEQYAGLIKEVSSHTHFVSVKAANIVAYYSLYHNDKDKGYRVMEISEETLKKYKDDLYSYNPGAAVPAMPMKRLADEKVNVFLADESFHNVGFILALNGEPLYVAQKSKNTLCLRGKLAGEKSTTNSLYGTMDLVEGLSQYNRDIRMVVREFPNLESKKNDQKAFAFMSGKYTDIPLSIIPKSISEIIKDGKLGRTEVTLWYIDHEFTWISLEFPEAADDFALFSGIKDKVIPGLILMSSDTGSSSLIIRGTYRVAGKSRYVVIDEYSHKHVGDITVEDILEACEREIMKNFRNLPEALGDKMGKIIGAKEIPKAIKKGFKETGLKKDLGIKRYKQLLDQILASIDPETVYSEYDIAMMFMGLPDRIQSDSEELMTRIARDCGKAPFISYGESEPDMEEEEELLLLPEE